MYEYKTRGPTTPPSNFAPDAQTTAGAIVKKVHDPDPPRHHSDQHFADNRTHGTALANHSHQRQRRSTRAVGGLCRSRGRYARSRRVRHRTARSPAGSPRKRTQRRSLVIEEMPSGSGTTTWISTLSRCSSREWTRLALRTGSAPRSGWSVTGLRLTPAPDDPCRRGRSARSGRLRAESMRSCPHFR